MTNETSKEAFQRAVAHLRYAEEILEKLTFYAAANKVSTIADYLRLDPLYEWQDDKPAEPRSIIPSVHRHSA
jgi:hypothetical protein